ncbi:hypothetical protein AMEJIAPC_00133 [Caulobacter sp. NIBR1757]|nr:hypothetical protein AMEJIAPC_00133 [Caulobacter sp. NIBR1757]
MWGWLRTLRKEGFHFRRQAPFHGYFLDFVCLSRKLVIELDGPSRGEEAQRRHDAIRDEVLEREGFTVLRIQNRTMDTHMPSVVDAIYDALRDRPPAW